MRFIGRRDVSGYVWLTAFQIVASRAVASNLSTLVKLPSLPVRPIIGFERFLPNRLRFLLACFEHALFAAANSLVSMQSFENELRRRYLLLGGLFRGNAERTQFVDQALDASQILQRL